MVNLRFLGAAGTVTGSRFLCESASSRILIEAGMFQGLRELRDKNWAKFPIPPESIDAVVLTHAHLDHCGYLPRLVRMGFQGKVYLTENSAKLVAIVLRDSAHLQVEDAEFARKKGYSKHAKPEPLYNLEDVERAIELFSIVPFGEKRAITGDASVTFYPSGHILGSAFIAVEMAGKKIVVSGDLGRSAHPLLVDPSPIPLGEVDALLVESTYGDREHEDTMPKLADVIRRTSQRGGSILIPAFAVDRTEILMMKLKELMATKAIPTLPIFVDSPMALASLKQYRAAIEHKSPEISPHFFHQSSDPFDAGDVREITTVEESKLLNDPIHPCIIISASGMATGGRVVHHLEHMLPHGKNAVVLVGYQAVGTRGRALVDGVRSIKMYGKFVSVGAEIVQVEGFSVHADADELVRWLRTAQITPHHTFVVHGEVDSSQALVEKIESELGWTVSAPKMDQTYSIA